jgi:phosphoribulokinase
MLKPVYDHSTGSLVRPEYVEPREFVIVEGLHGFHSATLRQFYDVKVYLDPPEDLRRVWKIKRDTTKRGYTGEQVRAEMERREADSREFIRPQREFADIVVQFSPDLGVAPEAADGCLNVRLVLRPTIPHPDLTYLLDNTHGAEGGVRMQLGRDCGRPVDFLDVHGGVTREQSTKLEDAIWQHLPDLRPLRADQFGDYNDRNEVRHSDPLAITQLLLTYHLLRVHSGDKPMTFASPVAALSRLKSKTRKPDPHMAPVETVTEK